MSVTLTRRKCAQRREDDGDRSQPLNEGVAGRLYGPPLFPFRHRPRRSFLLSITLLLLSPPPTGLRRDPLRYRTMQGPSPFEAGSSRSADNTSRYAVLPLYNRQLFTPSSRSNIPQHISTPPATAVFQEALPTAVNNIAVCPLPLRIKLSFTLL